MRSNSHQNPLEARRKAELAKIHLAKKELGLDEEAYRQMLWNCAKVHSAGDLDAAGRQAVLDHLQQCGFVGKDGKRRRPAQYPGRPRNMAVPSRKELLEKIEACLTERKLPWSYAETMANRICKKDAIEFCGSDDLWKIVAAFGYDAKRKGLPK